MDATYATVILWALIVVGFTVWRRLRQKAQAQVGSGRRETRGPERPGAIRGADPYGRHSAKQYVRGLALSDREQFIEIWKLNQARYPEDPRGAVLEANELITCMMRRRGYHLGDLSRPPRDAPPAHDRIVGNFQVASEIVTRYKRGQAGVEDLCKAMVCYRALFDQLLEVAAARR